MKKLVVLALVLAATPAFADDAIVASAPPPTTLGIDGIAVVPVGNYANVATIGIGATARLEVPAGSGFVTGRLGAIFHAMNTREAVSLTLVPAYAGYRLPVGTGGAYVAGELGITFAFATMDTSLGRVSGSDSELGLAVMAGLRRRTLDLRAGLFSPDVNRAVGLIASAGYDFAAF